YSQRSHQKLKQLLSNIEHIFIRFTTIDAGIVTAFLPEVLPEGMYNRRKEYQVCTLREFASPPSAAGADVRSSLDSERTGSDQHVYRVTDHPRRKRIR
ncbi:MAG: hypothetical protein ABJL67_00015, partial [Sulfitobacter sp.]